MRWVEDRWGPVFHLLGRVSSFVRKTDTSYRAEASCYCMKSQVRVEGCVWMLLAKALFNYLLSVSLRPFFYILPCDFGAETLQTTFPNLPGQLSIRSINDKSRGVQTVEEEEEVTSCRLLPPTCVDISGVGLCSRGLCSSPARPLIPAQSLITSPLPFYSPRLLLQLSISGLFQYLHFVFSDFQHPCNQFPVLLSPVCWAVW